MRDIVLSETYPHGRKRVWTCLTDPDLLAEWLMPNDFRPVLGHEFTFRTQPRPGFDGVVHAKVLEIVPPERLVITWAGGGIDTVVSFALTEVPGGTRLETLVHDGFRGLSNLMPRFFLGLGWRDLTGRKLPDYIARAKSG